MDVIDFRHKTLSRMVQFTAALDRLLKTLPPSLAKNKLQDQLGRSGSSVGANYAESGATESAKDFIHNLSIALKEAEETDYRGGVPAQGKSRVREDPAEIDFDSKEKSAVGPSRGKRDSVGRT